MSLYANFPKANLVTDWGQLLKLSSEEVASLHEQWVDIHSTNKRKSIEVVAQFNAKLAEVVTCMESQGIEVYNYKRNSIIPQKTGFKAWFKNNVVDDLTKKYPSYTRDFPRLSTGSKEVDGVKLYNNQSPIGIVEFHRILTYQYERGIKELRKSDKLLVKAVEYSTVNQLDISGLTPKEIINNATEDAKNKYVDTHHPNGSEVHLKHECDECSTFIMGSTRCSCGNVRISIVVEGDLLDGFYSYPETY